jgi:chromate transporter
MGSHLNSASSVPFGEALRFWLKLGFISFGGPAGQIALMHRELVDEKRWIGEARFLHALNYCMLLPGPEAQQLATYLGWLMHGAWGGIVAGLLFILPGLSLLIGLAWMYMSFGDVSLVAGVFYAIKPAVTAIVVHAAWRVGSRTLKNAALVAIAALAFVAIAVLKVPFPAVILAAALVGYWGAHRKPRWFTTVDAPSTPQPREASPPEAAASPARFRWRPQRALVWPRVASRSGLPP